MGVVKALLRFLSYLYHGLLCLILLALSALAIVTGAQTLHLEMLPWSGSTLLYAMFFGALFGLATVILAIKGSALRPLFFLWSLVVAVLMVKGYFLSSYHFSPGEFQNVLYLMAGSLIALLGSWFSMTAKRSKRRS